MSTIRIDKQFDLERNPYQEHSTLQNVCKICGWRGLIYYSYKKDHHEACRAERIAHRIACDLVEVK